MRECLSNALSAIAERDQLALALRRAYQQLHKELEKATENALRKLFAREKEIHLSTGGKLEQFERAVKEGRYPRRRGAVY